MNDLIDRRAAIDAAREELESGTYFDIPSKIEALPSAQPDMSEYSSKLWRNAYERGKRDAQPEIIWCKDCRKHNVSVGYKEDCCALFEWRGVSYGHEHDYQYCCYAERRTDE